MLVIFRLGLFSDYDSQQQAEFLDIQQENELTEKSQQKLEVRLHLFTLWGLFLQINQMTRNYKIVHSYLQSVK